MKAMAIDGFGAPPSLHDLPVPEPGEGEVLVRVRASSVNGLDVAVAGGYRTGMTEPHFPVVLGRDFAAPSRQRARGAITGPSAEKDKYVRHHRLRGAPPRAGIRTTAGRIPIPRQPARTESATLRPQQRGTPLPAHPHQQQGPPDPAAERMAQPNRLITIRSAQSSGSSGGSAEGEIGQQRVVVATVNDSFPTS
jgi:hypothetical protein